MKRSMSWMGLFLGLFLVSNAFASSAQQQQTAEVSTQQQAIEHSVAPTDSSSANLKVDLEYRTGVFAYAPIASVELPVMDDEQSTIIVNFQGRSFVSKFFVRAEAVDFIEGRAVWAVQVIRQDYTDGLTGPASAPVRFFLEEGAEHTATFKGEWGGQRQDLRLTFGL